MSKTGPSPRVRGSRRLGAADPDRLRSIPACAGKPSTSPRSATTARVHPRVCGEARRPAGNPPIVHGPSPRVRGSRVHRGRRDHRHGSIPACAGKPRRSTQRRPATGVHPRVCGEAEGGGDPEAGAAGPSPRVRGSPVRNAGQLRGPGSIPACAGKPATPTISRGGCGVHPCVCGEARSMPWVRCAPTGPSPRVRGSPARRGRIGGGAGSIPACAGKPVRGLATLPSCRVHPRVCGEAAEIARAREAMRGPSPRVRGSPSRADRLGYLLGSIPACAGKPPRRPGPGASPRVRGSQDFLNGTRPSLGSIPACAGKPDDVVTPESLDRVHPRVCGEAMLARCRSKCPPGPSPRVRGSRVVTPNPSTQAGSIPACAGKPCGPASPCGRRRVHPRVCGEAGVVEHQMLPVTGPSPRVRGSRLPPPPAAAAGGSIPACAGKPDCSTTTSSPSGVHPRVCGEATPRLEVVEILAGPSPRVRGSQAQGGLRALVQGSIPACAGKPSMTAPTRFSSTVHPRVCGEAFRVSAVPSAHTGPSPRVRGSRRVDGHRPQRGGSIPACAGKPPRLRDPPHPRRVHPRVCGEAGSRTNGLVAAEGPSPRVRGSRRRPRLDRAGPGSIPACAGKPRQS